MYSLKFKKSVQGDLKRIEKEAARKILQASCGATGLATTGSSTPSMTKNCISW